MVKVTNMLLCGDGDAWFYYHIELQQQLLVVTTPNTLTKPANAVEVDHEDAQENEEEDEDIEEFLSYIIYSNISLLFKMVIYCCTKY